MEGNKNIISPRFLPKIISNVLKLAKISEFQHKNDTFYVLRALFTFVASKNFLSPTLPPPQKKTDADTATVAIAFALYLKLVFC